MCINKVKGGDFPMLQWMTEAHHVSVITNLPDNDSDVIDGLIVRIAEGDRDALGELYALTSKGVFLIPCRYCEAVMMPRMFFTIPILP